MSNKNNNKVYMNNSKKSDLFAEILKLYWEILKKIVIKIIILYKRVNVNIQCSLSPLTYKFWQYNKYGKKVIDKMIIKQKNGENQENLWKPLEVCNIFKYYK